jgi:hypothetical protein
MTTPIAREPKPLDESTTPRRSADLADLTPTERLNIRQPAAALERRWKGRMNVERSSASSPSPWT